MDTLFEGYLAPNEFQLNCRSNPAFPEENHVFGIGYEHEPNFSLINGESSPTSIEISYPRSGSVEESSSSEGENFREPDEPDVILGFISQMLMEEEDLENKPCMLHDCLALQATEKSLYDVLNNNHGENSQSPNDPSNSFASSESSNDISTFLDSNWSNNLGKFETLISPEIQYPYNSQSDFLPYSPTGQFRALNSLENPFDPNLSTSREKKNRYRDEGDLREENRSNKQLANHVIESEPPLEMYDAVLLCLGSNNIEAETVKEKKKKPQRGRPRGGKKQANIIKEVVDLRSLLMQCAQALASYDTRTVNELLARIRRHSSPHGDGTERMAHYFANALEARLAGTGRASYAAFSSKISAAEILKGYQTFIMACPFRKMSNVVANKTIVKLAEKATTVHVVDFGILYGFQWPCLIQALSERLGGPPKLRITGIDFPQPGFRPAERVEDTGRRLKKYCERFNVPFEYIAVAKKWETVLVEDIKLEENELVVVNSLYRSQNVLDETGTIDSPRDAVLALIRRINPDMFIHGIINGAYNTPFFLTRFREAMFHFSSLFDMFEATVRREDANRLLFEEEVFGMDSMNVIACEGTERIDRPETYKQWHGRNVRAGFRQVEVDGEVVKFVKNKVREKYHRDFSVDEDGKWLLHGWKGRVLHAISCWVPKDN